MDTVTAVVLGAVQGLTEFLPVSSTAHLILARLLLGLEARGADALAFDALLHFATALAVLMYFRRDFLRLLRDGFRWVRGKEIARQEKGFILALMVGTVPAALAGAWGEKIVAETLRTPLVIAGGLLAGSALFMAAERWHARYGASAEYPTLRQGLLIGLFQALALVPGMSRSGATISGGLFAGLSRAAAARFSFMLALPIIVGAGSLEALSLWQKGTLQAAGTAVVAGLAAAFLSGMAAIHFLMWFLRTFTLTWFVYYRVALALALLFLVAWR